MIFHINNMLINSPDKATQEMLPTATDINAIKNLPGISEGDTLTLEFQFNDLNYNNGDALIINNSFGFIDPPGGGFGGVTGSSPIDEQNVGWPLFFDSKNSVLYFFRQAESNERFTTDTSDLSRIQIRKSGDPTNNIVYGVNDSGAEVHFIKNINIYDEGASFEFNTIGRIGPESGGGTSYTSDNQPTNIRLIFSFYSTGPGGGGGEAQWMDFSIHTFNFRNKNADPYFGNGMQDDNGNLIDNTINYTNNFDIIKTMFKTIDGETKLIIIFSWFLKDIPVSMNLTPNHFKIYKILESVYTGNINDNTVPNYTLKYNNNINYANRFFGNTINYTISNNALIIDCPGEVDPVNNGFLLFFNVNDTGGQDVTNDTFKFEPKDDPSPPSGNHGISHYPSLTLAAEILQGSGEYQYDNSPSNIIRRKVDTFERGEIEDGIVPNWFFERIWNILPEKLSTMTTFSLPLDKDNKNAILNKFNDISTSGSSTINMKLITSLPKLSNTNKYILLRCFEKGNDSTGASGSEKFMNQGVNINSINYSSYYDFKMFYRDSSTITANGNEITLPYKNISTDTDSSQTINVSGNVTDFIEISMKTGDPTEVNQLRGIESIPFFGPTDSSDIAGDTTDEWDYQNKGGIWLLNLLLSNDDSSEINEIISMWSRGSEGNADKWKYFGTSSQTSSVYITGGWTQDQTDYYTGGDAGGGAPSGDSGPAPPGDSGQAPDDGEMPPPGDSGMPPPGDSGTDAGPAPGDSGTDAGTAPGDSGTDAGTAPPGDSGTDAGTAPG